MGCGFSSSATKAEVSVHACYSFHRKLGQGTFGQVRACQNRRTHQKAAVKILDVQLESVLKKTRSEFMEQAEKEAFLWKKIGKHQNVVNLFETFNDERFVYMVMERCEYSMLDMLAKKEERLRESHLLQTFRQALAALEHLHTLMIAHRDVKPANFLVGCDGLVKICDFGLSDIEPEDGLKGLVGTAPFMAPEMLQERPYTRKVDIFSLGAMAFLMLYGHYPYFPGNADIDKANHAQDRGVRVSKAEMVRKCIARGTPPPKYVVVDDLPEPTDLARAFVKKLLERNPTLRPTASECLLLPAMVQGDKPSPDIVTSSSVQSLVEVVGRAKQNLAQFKTVVDPTVHRGIDELIEQLQKEYRQNGFSRSFSLPTERSAAPTSFRVCNSDTGCSSRAPSGWKASDNTSDCSSKSTTAASSPSSSSETNKVADEGRFQNYHLKLQK
jgi:serine/threonine protein kinase